MKVTYLGSLDASNAKFYDPNYTPTFQETSEIIISTSTKDYTLGKSEPFRQGVEIKNQKELLSGLVKILSGEDGHRLSPLTLGQRPDEENFWDDAVQGFEEQDCTDPVRILKNDYFRAVTATSENQSLYQYHQYDGVLEPLTIRHAAGLHEIYCNFMAHGIFGDVSPGNLGIWNRSAEDVVQVHDTADQSTIPYLDIVIEDMPIELPPRPGYFIYEEAKIQPFVDLAANELILDQFLSGDPINAVVNKLNYNDAEFLYKTKTSSPAGFTYDNCRVGTDSIAYGGLSR